MNRTPPKNVRERLRKEVGFGCPVPGCGNPYLSWHHFDPPWKVEKHHRLKGMIALCVGHHIKADAGAFTKEQLAAFKKNVPRNEVRGRFDWMRYDILAAIGGNFYCKSLELLKLGDDNVVWFEKDEEEYLMLNLKMITMTNDDRAVITNNDWMVLGEPTDVESPPSGKSVRICYENGDDLKVSFSEIRTVEQISKKYPEIYIPDFAKFAYPLTLVEVFMNIGGSDFHLTPTGMYFPRRNHMTGNLIVGPGILPGELFMMRS